MRIPWNCAERLLPKRRSRNNTDTSGSVSSFPMRRTALPVRSISSRCSACGVALPAKTSTPGFVARVAVIRVCRRRVSCGDCQQTLWSTPLRRRTALGSRGFNNSTCPAAAGVCSQNERERRDERRHPMHKSEHDRHCKKGRVVIAVSSAEPAIRGKRRGS